jgi:hypothetical protein
MEHSEDEAASGLEQSRQSASEGIDCPLVHQHHVCQGSVETALAECKKRTLVGGVEHLEVNALRLVAPL